MEVLNFILFTFCILILGIGGIQTFSMFKKWIESRFKNHTDDSFQYLLIFVGAVIAIGCTIIWALFIWPYFEGLPT